MQQIQTTYQGPIHKFKEENLFFTSDTHFGHQHIIQFSGRPFRNAAEMDAELIRRWNETVSPDSTVFHLGDFCWGGPNDWISILERLNGKIYLILGNHDLRRIKASLYSRFELVTSQMTIKVGSQGIILNHYPFLCYGGAYRDVWQLFGHVHSGPLSKNGADMPRLRMLFPLQYDVGVDNNDFRPISFEGVKKKIEQNVKKARQTLGIGDVKYVGGTRRIIFIDSSTDIGPEEKAALEKISTDMVVLGSAKKMGVKEAIADRMALFGGPVRYVYIGAEKLDDYRSILVENGRPITGKDVEMAGKILE